MNPFEIPVREVYQDSYRDVFTRTEDARVRSKFATYWEAYEKGEYTDMTVVCGGKSFNLHRAVICSQSERLAEMVREEEFWRGISANVRIELPSEIAELFGFVVHFLYNGFFNWETHPNLGRRAPKLFAIMYAAGASYEIPNMKDYSSKKYREYFFGSACHYRPFNDSDICALFYSIPAVYNLTLESDQTLRRTAMDVMRAWAHDVEVGQEFTLEFDQARLDVLAEVPEFMQDVCRHVTTGPTLCERCGRYENYRSERPVRPCFPRSLDLDMGAQTFVEWNDMTKWTFYGGEEMRGLKGNKRS